MKIFVLSALLIISVNMVQAANVDTPITTIIKLNAYVTTSAWDGDIEINVNDSSAGCESGYWLKYEDKASYKNIVSILLSAFHAGSLVKLTGDDTQRWPVSSSNYCRLHTVSLSK